MIEESRRRVRVKPAQIPSAIESPKIRIVVGSKPNGGGEGNASELAHALLDMKGNKLQIAIASTKIRLCILAFLAASPSIPHSSLDRFLRPHLMEINRFEKDSVRNFCCHAGTLLHHDNSSVK